MAGGGAVAGRRPGRTRRLPPRVPRHDPGGPGPGGPGGGGLQRPLAAGGRRPRRRPPAGPLRLVGGGTQSLLWCQILADVTGRPVERVADPLLTGLRGRGAAQRSRAGCGHVGGGARPGAGGRRARAGCRNDGRPTTACSRSSPASTARSGGCSRAWTDGRRRTREGDASLGAGGRQGEVPGDDPAGHGVQGQVLGVRHGCAAARRRPRGRCRPGRRGSPWPARRPAGNAARSPGAATRSSADSSVECARLRRRLQTTPRTSGSSTKFVSATSAHAQPSPRRTRSSCAGRAPGCRVASSKKPVTRERSSGCSSETSELPTTSSSRQPNSSSTAGLAYVIRPSDRSTSVASAERSSSGRSAAPRSVVTPTMPTSVAVAVDPRVGHQRRDEGPVLAPDRELAATRAPRRATRP